MDNRQRMPVVKPVLRCKVFRKWFARMNSLADEDRVKAHPGRAEDIGSNPVSDRQHLVGWGLARPVQGVPINSFERFAVPCHAPAELLVKVRNRARASLHHAASDDNPVGIKAMHMDVPIGPPFEIGAIFLRSWTLGHDARAGELGEVIARGNPDAPPLKNLTVAWRPNEAHWIRKGVQRFDPRFAACRDEIIGFARQSDMFELLLHRVGGAGRIGNERDAPALAAPLAQPLLGAGV